MRFAKTGRKTSRAASAVWHVAPSCWNQMLPISSFSIFVNENMPQNIKCSFGCVARSTVLLKSNVAHILLFNFCEQKFVQHGAITTTIDYNSLSFLIFKNKFMPLDQNPHQTVTRFSIYACGFSVPQMRQFCLFTNPPRSKWISFEKTIFFAKIGIFCKSIDRRCSSVYTTIFVRRKVKTNYLANQTWAKCYLSRNNSWKKKNVRWRTLYNVYLCT